MNTKKKIIITILLLLTALAPIVFFLFSKRGQQTEQFDTPIPIPIIEDKIKKQSYEIKFNVSENQFKFPKKLNLLTYEAEELDQSYLENIAQKLDFEKEPEIVDDVFDGKIITYVNDNAYLLSSFELGEITYGLHQFPQLNNSISEEIIIQKARDFLTVNNFTETSQNIVTSIQYFKIAPTETILEPISKPEVEVYRINFTPNISEYPILTQSPEKTLTYVQVMSDGTIQKAVTTKLRSIETNSERSLKDYQEVKESINDAIIASVNNGLLFISTIPENSIREINITSIDLAYLQASDDIKTIQPVYLLSGTANLEYKGILPITLYLQAISKNN